MVRRALAYPLPNDKAADDALHPDYMGMEIRDVFAGQVVAALVSQSVTRFGGNILQSNDAVKELVRLSYLVADAMMIEREHD